MPRGDLHFHLVVTSRFENAELVQVVLEDALERRGVDEDTRHWVGVALREAVANAIRHGNGTDPEKSVTVELRVEDGGIEIAVRDEGKGFDPGALDDPLAPENLLKPGGRGVFYMRRLMDEVDFRFHPEGGTEVVLTKRLPGPEDDAQNEEES